MATVNASKYGYMEASSTESFAEVRNGSTGYSIANQPTSSNVIVRRPSFRSASLTSIVSDSENDLRNLRAAIPATMKSSLSFSSLSPLIVSKLSFNSIFIFSLIRVLVYIFYNVFYYFIV